MKKTVSISAIVIMSFLLLACASKPAGQNSEIPGTSGIPESADITRTMGRLNADVGDAVTLPLSGRLVQIGNTGLPASFGPDTLVFNVTHQYWLDGGEQAFGNYQLIMSGIQPADEMRSISSSTEISQGTAIGTAVSSPVLVNLRCRAFDLYLCDTSTTPPELINGWYYFGVGMLMSSTPKFLDYQPVTSAQDEIPFWDYPESLAQMSLSNRRDYESSKRGDVYSGYPPFSICLETTLDRYPSTDLQFATAVSPATRLWLLSEYPNCHYYLPLDFDGVPVQLFFQDGFDQYLKDEYTLGEPIWLYLQAQQFLNGELLAYVRDFTLIPPVERAVTAQNSIREYIARLDGDL